jgi:hypothetical protein
VTSQSFAKEEVLAFRLARAGLDRRRRVLAKAAACPLSDFNRDAALLALGARAEGLSRGTYEDAVDNGTVVLAHVIRGAIHAVAPDDFALYGRVLLASDDAELGAQLGRQVQRLSKEKGFAPTDALEQVAAATTEALARGRKLDKNGLHEELRARVSAELMPWCRSCGSHHVAPMLWRYATVRAGVRLDSQRRYLMGRPGRAPSAGEAVRRFLRFYGPARPAEFSDWAGLASSHGQRLWGEVEGDLVEVRTEAAKGWVLEEDLDRLSSPPDVKGLRLLPPGDPYLQKPNRSLLAPDVALRKRLFRPVASPGAVLKDGRLAGLWKAKLKGEKAEVTIERIGRVSSAGLEEEARRIAKLRGAGEATVVLA